MSPETADRQSYHRVKVPAQVLRQRVRVSVGVAFAAAMDTGDLGDAWIWG